MPPKKKRENVHNDHRLTRPPLRESPNLYPDLNAEKENLDFSSSDDSPEKKYPYSLSPRKPVKNNSPSSPDFMQDVANVTRHRSGRHQQKEMNRFPDRNISPESRYSENSDAEIETDYFLDNKYPHNQRQSSESPESDRPEDSSKAQGRLNQFGGVQSQSLRPEIWNERNHSSDSTSSSFIAKSGIYLILFCILLFLSFFMRYGYPAPSNVKSQPSGAILMNSLKAKFKDQPPLTFRIIGSALKNVLEAQPKSPAIILLLATNGSQTICSDFALSLVNSLSVPEHIVKIFGKDYKEANANQAKMKIDQIINKELKINQLGSVLIYDLDQIPGQAAIILHKYYDHENAPFKKAVFVMTVNYNKPINDYSDTKVWDKAAYDHLLSLWTDSGVDQITALLSRLTVSVAVIRTKTSS